jgi:hypothetical protein
MYTISHIRGNGCHLASSYCFMLLGRRHCCITKFCRVCHFIARGSVEMHSLCCNRNIRVYLLHKEAYVSTPRASIPLDSRSSQKLTDTSSEHASFPVFQHQPLSYHSIFSAGFELRVGRPGFCSRKEQEIFLLSTASRPLLGPTQPPIQ